MPENDRASRVAKCADIVSPDPQDVDLDKCVEVAASVCRRGQGRMHKFDPKFALPKPEPRNI